MPLSETTRSLTLTFVSSGDSKYPALKRHSGMTIRPSPMGITPEVIAGADRSIPMHGSPCTDA